MLVFHFLLYQTQNQKQTQAQPQTHAQTQVFTLLLPDAGVQAFMLDSHLLLWVRRDPFAQSN